MPSKRIILKYNKKLQIIQLLVCWTIKEKGYVQSPFKSSMELSADNYTFF